MREIKFRAWTILGKNKSFIYFDLDERQELDFDIFDQPPIIQQYTGLQDKHGKDIYEGDILFFQQQDGVWPNQLNKNIEVKYPLVCGNTHLGEIVGNIFENSELLNQ